MADILKLICWAVIGLFRSRASLEAEILMLRQQVNVLRGKSPKRLGLSNVDCLIFAGLYQIAPRVLDALTIVEPETVVRWHRAGFRMFWRWKSRRRGGSPKVALEIRQLIRDMSLANPLWGAPRIHGELLKLGIDVGQTSVAKYMAKRRKPPSQRWKTILRNHADGIASMDLFVVPTISFRLIGPIRRECLDHVVVFGERHPRHVLLSYMEYFNGARTHLALSKDARVSRAIQAVGRTFPMPILGGLHHHYVRI